nr:UvrD-like helicase, ATP-binding domain, P-loop containing nucleoside triphosphate hydrolase [Tanacetum cinerariifolium]
MSFQRSKEDHVMHISKSIFVTNFTDKYEARDLWKICEGYGKVVDVFIPNRKSKAGKRFAFVRFVRVEDIDRLVGNLCTIWICRLHLYANVVHYEWPSRPYNSAGYRQNKSCVIERDILKHAMGRVKDINSIPNLRSLFMDEEFHDVKLMYLGGMWDAVHDFVSDKRIVWVDIEGIPLNVWSHETFLRIEDMIRVGQAMGYTIDGCIKDLEHIIDYSDKKITWAVWDKVLASKKNGGLGVLSFHALNHALLLKWVFPRMFALEMEKEVSVAVKMGASMVDSFHRVVRDGTEHHQMLSLNSMLELVSFSSAQDRWICDLSGDGEFRVIEVRNILDDLFLPA